MPNLNKQIKYRQKKKSTEYILGLEKKMGRFCDKPSSVPYADSHIAHIVR